MSECDMTQLYSLSLKLAFLHGLVNRWGHAPTGGAFCWGFHLIDRFFCFQFCLFLLGAVIASLNFLFPHIYSLFILVMILMRLCTGFLSSFTFLFEMCIWSLIIFFFKSRTQFFFRHFSTLGIRGSLTRDWGVGLGVYCGPLLSHALHSFILSEFL